MRWATESKESTSYGSLDLGVHDRINDLYRRAFRLAPAAAHSAAESGCTDTRPVSGTRRQKAWDMLWEAHCWNAVSDQPETLAACEQAERDGRPYELLHGYDTSGRFVVSMQFLPAEEPASTAVTRKTPALEVHPGMCLEGTGMIECVTQHGKRLLFRGPLGHRYFGLSAQVQVSELTADDVITAVTLARNDTDAADVMKRVRSRAMLLKVADLLFIEPDGHANNWLRAQIAETARA